ncbi:hypothetical protein ACFOWE_00155 [Planomonospora corallina]|uniref:Uncharacterized protein n=1 Tax=Planomonospora corallina TaxID=1806052 RepID=A0ABV8I0U4_9ACTN
MAGDISRHDGGFRAEEVIGRLAAGRGAADQGRRLMIRTLYRAKGAAWLGASAPGQAGPFGVRPDDPAAEPEAVDLVSGGPPQDRLLTGPTS